MIGKRETRDSDGTYSKDKGKKGCRQCPPFFESCVAGDAIDLGRKAKPRGGFRGHRIFNKPWNLKDEGLVWELLLRVPNQFDFTVIGKLEQWTAIAWRETYGFKPEGYRWTSVNDKYTINQFQNLVNPNDGFTIGDCKDR